MEHQQKMRSLRPVPEFGEHILVKQPGRSSRLVGRLFSTLKDGLAVLQNLSFVEGLPSRLARMVKASTPFGNSET